jgi:hypothetical protein
MDDEGASDTETGSISSQVSLHHPSATKPILVPSSNSGPLKPPIRPRGRFTTFQTEGALDFEAGSSTRKNRTRRKTPEVGAGGLRTGTV